MNQKTRHILELGLKVAAVHFDAQLGPGLTSLIALLTSSSPP